jgi:hypothetical protein
LIILALILSTLANLVLSVQNRCSGDISRKTMENLYNAEIDKAQSAGTKEEHQYHLNKAAGMWDVYINMGFEMKVYENDHIKIGL